MAPLGSGLGDHRWGRGGRPLGYASDVTKTQRAARKFVAQYIEKMLVDQYPFEIDGKRISGAKWLEFVRELSIIIDELSGP